MSTTTDLVGYPTPDLVIFEDLLCSSFAVHAGPGRFSTPDLVEFGSSLLGRFVV